MKARMNERKKRILTFTIIAFAVFLVFAALIVVGALLLDRYPWLIFVACGCAAIYVLATAAILLKVSKTVDIPSEPEHEPYEIQHPLFKRISDQYDADGLADFVDYVSLRGWKLGFVERKEDSIEFIFTRKERQTGVILSDGEAKVSVDLQTEDPQDTLLDMDAFPEPIDLWNGIISAGRDAARRNDA